MSKKLKVKISSVTVDNEPRSLLVLESGTEFSIKQITLKVKLGDKQVEQLYRALDGLLIKLYSTFEEAVDAHLCACDGIQKMWLLKMDDDETPGYGRSWFIETSLRWPIDIPVGMMIGRMNETSPEEIQDIRDAFDGARIVTPLSE